MRRERQPATKQGMGSPDFSKRKPLLLTELPAEQLGRFPGGVTVRLFLLGECTVIVTRNPPFMKWHLSIAHKHRYPTWDEIAEARYRICPGGITMALFLPPKSEYVNIDQNCFQLHEVDDERGGIVR